jgi:Putative cyclase
VRTVTRGQTVSCARPLAVAAAGPGSVGGTCTDDAEPRPAGLEVLRHGPASRGGLVLSGDRLIVAPHGPLHTHIDALCHACFDGKMYNGRPAEEIGRDGARANDIAVLADGICTRGVLLDVPRLRGTYVRPETPVRLSELLAAELKAGVRVGPGDAVLVRLGREARFLAEGGPGCERTAYGGVSAQGLHPECLTFLRDRDVAVLVSDVGHDAFPAGFGLDLPVHIGALVYLGMPLVDCADLEGIAAVCASGGRWQFLLTIAPARIPGATSSLVNPIAMF